MNQESEIVIYQSSTGGLELRADVDSETIWASQAQIAEAFGVTSENIIIHMKNIYSSQELSRNRTTKKFLVVRLEGKRQVERQIDHYNLDMILSVGYRVNSKKATKFRQWATQILHEHITSGYTINQQRLGQLEGGINDVHRALELARQAISKQGNGDLSEEVLSMLERYTRSLSLLQSYDQESIKSPKGKKASRKISYRECVKIIENLRSDLIARSEATALFGNERESGLESIIGSIYQTFDGHDLYPTIEDKAANILYLIIKDHPFSDGNKRTGAFLFVYFLNKTNHLFRKDGEIKISDNTLVTLALLIAESDPKDKELLINLTKQLLVN